MILEDLARAFNAVSKPEALAAFVDLAKGSSPEDAYLEHACGANRLGLAFIPSPLKKTVRDVPNFGDFYKQLSFWIPKVDMPANWSTFKSFYEPLLNAGLLNGKYKVTEMGRELYNALETLVK
jgi:hypothetical protein